MRSLRAQLLLGAGAWSAGAALAAACLSLFALRQHLDRNSEAPLHPQINAISLSVGGVVASVLLVIGVILVVASLRPLTRLRDALTQLRGGMSAQVRGHFPAEVQPLVDDLNRLLLENERIVQNARTQAGNLAHGLKTPLAVMSNEILPDDLRVQVEGMRRTIAYHLARARAASPAYAGQRCDVAASCERLFRAMRAVHRHRDLDLRADVPAGLICRGNCTDFEEMLGNLIDNACRFAASSVIVLGRQLGEEVEIEISDDGPGMHEGAIEQAYAWGAKGFGGAIARQLAESHGGHLALATSPQGVGLKATVRLPSLQS